MNEIHGVTGKPYRHPQTRRKIPAEHQRPRIDLDGGTRAKRSWKDTPVINIVVGDTVSCVGRITAVQEFIRVPGAFTPVAVDEQLSYEPVGEDYDGPYWLIRLTNAFAEDFEFDGHQRLFAFTPDPDPEP